MLLVNAANFQEYVNDQNAQEKARNVTTLFLCFGTVSSHSGRMRRNMSCKHEFKIMNPLLAIRYIKTATYFTPISLFISPQSLNPTVNFCLNHKTDTLYSHHHRSLGVYTDVKTKVPPLSMTLKLITLH